MIENTLMISGKSASSLTVNELRSHTLPPPMSPPMTSENPMTMMIIMTIVLPKWFCCQTSKEIY